MKHLSVLSAILLSATLSALAAEEAVGPKRPAVAIRVTNPGITLDGKLDEEVWQKAPDNTRFELNLNRPAREVVSEEVQTHFRVLYDNDTIYFGIRCNDSAMEKLRPFEAHGSWDSAMWMHDTVELFFDPTGARKDYYHFAIDPENSQFDDYAWKGFSSIWKTAAYKGSDFWSAEIAIPFSALWFTPANTWSTNWTFSFARLVHTHGLSTMFSPLTTYHDVKNFGALGPIEIPKDRFNLIPGTPKFRLVKSSDRGFGVETFVEVANAGDKDFQGKATMCLLGEEKNAVETLVSIKAGASVTVKLNGQVDKEGPHTFQLRWVNADGKLETGVRVDTQLTYAPVAITLQQPVYRNNIYATEHIENIKGTATLDMSEAHYKNATLRVSLSGDAIETRSTNTMAESSEVAFQIDSRDLPVGAFRLCTELIKGTNVIASAETRIRKLAPAPDVEVRIDELGNLVVDGKPVMARGWYGGFGDNFSDTSALHLPASCNFNWGGVRGKWNLASIRELVNDQKAKANAPLDEELKQKIRKVIAGLKGNKQTIAYYISEEPAGFGLRPEYIRNLYNFVREEDPYRTVILVGSWPAGFMQAADVNVQQPYLCPRLFPDGTRMFRSDVKDMRKCIQEAVACRTSGKAVWCRQQTFSYPLNEDARFRHPDLKESRWFAYTSIINGCRSLVPFHALPYLSIWQNRVAMDAVFEDMAWLEPLILQASGPAFTCNNPEIDVWTRSARHEGPEQTFILAANQTYSNQTATIKVDSLTAKKNARLFVTRENRVIPVENGQFTDTFEGLGVHVYTTLELLPDFRSIQELEAQINAPFDQQRKEGNLLLAPGVKWTSGVKVVHAFMEPDPTSDQAGLVDGRLQGGWSPWNDDPNLFMITLEKPLIFARVRLLSSTIRDADLQVLKGKDWITMHEWRNHYLNTLEWKGQRLATDHLRIKVLSTRSGTGGPSRASIGDIGLYEK